MSKYIYRSTTVKSIPQDYFHLLSFYKRLHDNDESELENTLLRSLFNDAAVGIVVDEGDLSNLTNTYAAVRPCAVCIPKNDQKLLIFIKNRRS